MNQRLVFEQIKANASIHCILLNCSVDFFRKMKMYEEQELTMQVFSEPEMVTNGSDVIVSPFELFKC